MEYCGRDHCRYCTLEASGAVDSDSICPRLTEEQRERVRSARERARVFKALEPTFFTKLRDKIIERDRYWNPDGTKIPVAFRFVELAGEAGEVCNAGKKLARHEMGMVGGSPDLTNLREELGDVLISCQLIANEFNLDLGDCVIEKFNKTSDKHGFPTRMEK